jgi:transcriptional regulator with XRE-family HTH domain
LEEDMNRRARPAPAVPQRPDPELWERPEVRAILAERDIAALIMLLQRHGFSQRRLAALVGMSQSEISEIKGGRRVGAYDVFLRVAQGLGVPLVYMGLAHPPPLWERAEPAPDPDPKPAPVEPGCVVLRYAVAEFVDGNGATDPVGTLAARCGVDPCAARLLAALAAGLAIATDGVSSAAETSADLGASGEPANGQQPAHQTPAVSARGTGADAATG